MSKTISPEHELEIQRGIRYTEDALVIAVEDALNTCEYPTSGRDKLEESQFRNLVRVADSTESPEVVKNFIRYQVGRERKWGRGEKSLAERIIRDIDGELKNSAQGIVEAAQEKDEKKRVQMELIRRYLGYGARHLRYLNTNREG
ncbi:MAG: hypothetical protein AAF609_14545 [Cyanobacteria bacterium P01_C01_bin.120]